MNSNYTKNYKNNNSNNIKKKTTVKGSSKSSVKKPNPNVIKKKEPVVVKKPNEDVVSNYIATTEEVNNIRENVMHTVPIKRRKKKQDPRDLAIILGIAIIAIIASWFLLGKILTILLTVGILLIVGCSVLLKKSSKNGKKRTVLNVILILFLSLCIIGSLGVGGFLIYVVKTAPDFDPNNLSFKQSSIMYDSNNEEILKLGAEVREDVTYEQLPQVFVDAIIATEDARFFQHNGFDASRFIVASVKQVLGKDAGGASTLSMQVVKNAYTDPSLTSGIKGIARKFTDIYLAVFQLEKNYSKEQIIEFYVNSQCLNGTVCGVEQAAQTYFGKSISDVNLAEASLLAGMFQAPTSYNPYNNPTKAQTRRSQVLYYMVRHGYITQAEADAANDIPVSSLLTTNTKTSSEYQAYIDTVLEELENKYNINPYNVSVEVYTNMNKAKQNGINAIFNGSSFNWENSVVQGAAAAIDVDTGKIIAIGAGRNRTGIRSLNFATQLKNQIGSTAKPIFDYAPGMEFLNWSTYTQFVDEPWSYSSGQAINNSDRKFMGQISIRTALAQSRNIPALKAFQTVSSQVGNSKLFDFVTSLGITPEGNNGYVHEAHSLGAFNGASPLQMAGAYAAFANGGYYNEPYTVSKIVYRDTGEVIEHKENKTQVMSDSTAFMITDSLKSAVNDGISSGAAISGVNVAAKTGTTNFDEATFKAYNLPSNAVNDAWIVGYDPDTALAMWYGYDKINKDYISTNVSAVKQRALLYKALGNAVYDKTGKDFTIPSSVVRVGVEAGSNPALLPSDNTPANQIVYEYFKAGTEPTEVSTKYVKLTAPTGLNASYNNGKVTLNWNRVNSQSGNSSYGSFGYRVYYNNTELGFTTENSFTIETTDPDGIYKVVTCFQNYTANQSDPNTYTLKTKSDNSDNGDSGSTTSCNYSITYDGKSNNSVIDLGTCSEGNTSCFDANDSKSKVKILDGTKDISSTFDITISYIKDSSSASSFDATAGDWLIKYIATAKSESSCTKTIQVKIKVN